MDFTKMSPEFTKIKIRRNFYAVVKYSLQISLVGKIPARPPELQHDQYFNSSTRSQVLDAKKSRITWFSPHKLKGCGPLEEELPLYQQKTVVNASQKRILNILAINK